MSDNDIYLLIKYIKNVVCRVAKRLSHIEDARCLKIDSSVTILIKKNSILQAGKFATELGLMEKEKKSSQSVAKFEAI
jgi:hypothetical protein